MYVVIEGIKTFYSMIRMRKRKVIIECHYGDESLYSGFCVDFMGKWCNSKGEWQIKHNK